MKGYLADIHNRRRLGWAASYFQFRIPHLRRPVVLNWVDAARVKNNRLPTIKGRGNQPASRAATLPQVTNLLAIISAAR